MKIHEGSNYHNWTLKIIGYFGNTSFRITHDFHERLNDHNGESGINGYFGNMHIFSILPPMASTKVRMILMDYRGYLGTLKTHLFYSTIHGFYLGSNYHNGASRIIEYSGKTSFLFYHQWLPRRVELSYWSIGDKWALWKHAYLFCSTTHDFHERLNDHNGGSGIIGHFENMHIFSILPLMDSMKG